MSAGSLFPGGLGPAGVGGVLNETSPGAAAPLDSQLDFSFLDYAAQTNNASSTGGGLNQVRGGKCLKGLWAEVWCRGRWPTVRRGRRRDGPPCAWLASFRHVLRRLMHL